QLITQAAGRAGRGSVRGKVIIQTYSPEHYAIGFSAAQDYDGFFREEREFRRLMKYPPYSDLIQVLFTAKDSDQAEAGAQSWYDRLQQRLAPDDRPSVLPPQQAYMSKIREIYRFSIVIRCPQGRRREYTDLLRTLKEEDARRRTKYLAVVDINPYSFA
ncbi:MAG: primosomal protein N', partial [Bacillota bacterium]|nr:primosomal protein N' [Bacillota bacterium]